MAKFLADVTWWLAILASVGLILFWAAATLGGGGAKPMTVAVQVAIADSAARGMLPLVPLNPGMATQPVLKDVAGTLEFGTSEGWIVLLGGLVVLPGLAALLFGLHLLRSFLRDVLAADVFTAANARRLSSLGWVLVAAGVVLPVLEFLYTAFVVRRADLAGVPLRVGMHSSLIVPGILVLVVAAAWRYGVELQRDQELTV
ncbi:MAG: hypothetical protein AVDCRST_MAG89-4563 [uncultured Gemmatimonadetes bacterium]|uniref:DUF2975 domain-containing protein n=1 Tax=uncultured Gemmatimonadota bacterium TaxID=203437 RepID=A0A6J4MVY5_9BACT|nr:MAG: hypothetical protein AVDCRST_MAG89-4563 [uncultured Gemmatimonadota bacterium]